ncbi:DNA topoisomerase 3-alpha [Daktulosphaira vitifoliae]|uniref:DNA topoisomerase 3-alpha n=1 Tax=Daktulosphaira vitifoliae TaxID=58002 RepID=UPI0021AA7E5C|nr:DNA topoisomerase 3-alpha [Daktulosphaira vitifoliae]
MNNSRSIYFPYIFNYIRRISDEVKKNIKMRVLNVAEKNDAAKNIAGYLSNGNCQRREGISKFNKIYEFNHTFRGSPCTMVMTSVSGHLLGFEFQGPYRLWNSCSPLDLFNAPVIKECPKKFVDIKNTLVREIRTCNALVIWTDADREGENIGFEIIQVCKEVNPNIQVYRAILSEITKQSVQRAINNLGYPNKNISDAVDVRSELDLRIGAAFTRYQTLRLRNVFPDVLANSLISYGSCQFPTLGFVVERYKDIQNFIPEQFWKIKVNHKIGEVDIEYAWHRVRLFDELFCKVLFERCLENQMAHILNVIKKPKSKWRPVPLDTIELEKTASRKLGINAKETMKIAEKLYSQGYISYPRTETNIFPKELNLNNLVQLHIEDNNWGTFAEKVLHDGPSPRQGKKSDQAHPPIHPTKYTNGLQDPKDRKVYEYIVRHFLACLSKDAQGQETIVNIEINGEKFSASGLQIIALNYLEVYIYEKWSNKLMHEYNQGETFMPTRLEMTDGQTSAPNLLTESDLITLMDKHGIGTDATHAEHIETIKSRLYVGLENNKYFVPGELGIGLVEGYDNMGFEMSKPRLRSELEADLKRICEGTKSSDIVLKEQIAKYKEVFIKTTEQVEKLDQSLGKYLRAQPIAYHSNQSLTLKDVCKCPACKQFSLILKERHNNQGFYISCNGYPTCRNTYWFPPNVIGATVIDNVCPECSGNVKLINFQFSDRSMRPHFPNNFTGCINGCESRLSEILQVNLSRPATNFNSINTSRNNQSSSNYNNVLRINTQQHSNNNLGLGSQYNNNDIHSSNVQQYQRNSHQRPTSQYNNTGPGRGNSAQQYQTNNSHRSASTPSINTDQVCCNCGEGAKLLTVTKNTPNKGRQFYGCSKPISQSNRCTFFLWADQSASTVSTTQPPYRNNNNRSFQNSTFRARNNQSSSSGQGQRKCGNCKQTGHTRRNCPQIS